MQRCTAFIARRPITGSFRFFCTSPPLFLCFITIFYQHLWCPSHIFYFILLPPCFAKITSHVNTSFKAFLAKMGTLSGSTRPALRFSHLTRLSRSAGSRFSHGPPTSPAFPALGKAFAERKEQIFAWSAD